MICRPFLRIASLAALAASAASACATDLYSNFPGTYYSGSYNVAPTETIGFQFTPTLSGTASSFTLPLTNLTAGAQLAYTLSLYADDGANKLGSLLGTYSGLSTGENYNYATGLSVVPATGAPVALTAGSKYWLVAASSFSLTWNLLNGGVTQPCYYTYLGDPYYETPTGGAFSVQASPVPEPSALAALGLGAVALLRRRKRA